MSDMIGGESGLGDLVGQDTNADGIDDLFVGDRNQDGVVDLVAEIDPSGAMTVYSDDDATPGLETAVSFDSNGIPVSFASDVDGDTVPDVTGGFVYDPASGGYVPVVEQAAPAADQGSVALPSPTFGDPGADQGSVALPSPTFGDGINHEGPVPMPSWIFGDGVNHEGSVPMPGNVMPSGDGVGLVPILPYSLDAENAPRVLEWLTDPGSSELARHFSQSYQEDPTWLVDVLTAGVAEGTITIGDISAVNPDLATQVASNPDLRRGGDAELPDQTHPLKPGPDIGSAEWQRQSELWKEYNENILGPNRPWTKP